MILPGIYRLDPEWIGVSCRKWINLLWSENRKGKPEVFDALEKLVGKEIASVKRFRAENRITETGRPTQLECVDVLFGDAWNVFLSPHRERFAGAQGALIFDAYDLVEKGAALRTIDFIYGYRQMIEDLLAGRGAHEDVRDPVERIMAAAEDVGKGEITGNEALGELNQMAINLDHNYDADIVWNGPLPIEWAIKVLR